MKGKKFTCRSCGGSDLNLFLNLGTTPLADRLITEETLRKPEPRFRLEIAFCPACTLVQILETVSPELLFCEDYPYYSSFSPMILENATRNALSIMQTRELRPDSLVVELASNDGYLLKNYVEKKIPVLGIDPAEGPVKTAVQNQIPTIHAFFNKALAYKLIKEGKRADVIHANNVLAHVKDINDFVAGIRVLLKPNGIAVIEVPYLKNLIEKNEFDTIYHEHLCYFSISALVQLFERHSLYLNDVKPLSIHGGSVRLYVSQRKHLGESVLSMVEVEKRLEMDRIIYYQDFSQKVETLKKDLIRLLREIKSNGKRIAAYGAAAKGATLINYTGIGTDLVDFVVDQNFHKHGCYMPGKHIKIYGIEKLYDEMPDYLLLLAWNFVDEIYEQQTEFREKGGRFIVPIPEPKILD